MESSLKALGLCTVELHSPGFAVCSKQGNAGLRICFSLDSHVQFHWPKHGLQCERLLGAGRKVDQSPLDCPLAVKFCWGPDSLASGSQV